MKTIKMRYATALLSLAATALVGTSSATAETTALCSQSEYPCGSTHLVTHVHEATISGAKAKLLTSSLTVECDVLFLGDTTTALASPLVIAGKFTYSNCNSSCTVGEGLAGARIEVLKEGHETAAVTGEREMEVSCPFFKCVYNGEGLAGTAKGWWLSSGAYANGEVAISEQTMNRVNGVLCPSESRLDITTTPLSRMLISS